MSNDVFLMMLVCLVFIFIQTAIIHGVSKLLLNRFQWYRNNQRLLLRILSYPFILILGARWVAIMLPVPALFVLPVFIGADSTDNMLMSPLPFFSALLNSSPSSDISSILLLLEIAVLGGWFYFSKWLTKSSQKTELTEHTDLIEEDQEDQTPTP